MKIGKHLIGLLLALALLAPAQAQAQAGDTLELFVRRNVGYSGVGEIQGSFRLEATAPPDVSRVTFYIDQTVVGIDAEAPFRVDFDTDAYAPGPHTLLAEGDRANGSFLTSAPREFKFVTAAESWQAAQGIFVPIIVILLSVVVLVAIMATLQAMYNKRNPTPLGARRNYGVFGGTICPKCKRPYSRHIWGVNAVAGKLDRCNHCGKWSLTHALPLEQLRAAEAAELKTTGAATVPDVSAEERLRKQIDDSRYTDHTP